MKKVLALMLTVVMTLALFAGCRGGGEDEVVDGNGDGVSTVDPSTDGDGGTGNSDFKIALVTGTVSQGEEEFRKAEDLKKKYGDMIITKTYPDNFTTETETYISILTELANDPDVKAIVVCQAVQGTSAAFDRVRETREDILLVAAVPSEDPGMIADKADFLMLIDELGTGRAIIEQAKAQGAKTFVHYSFPRHLSMETLKMRQDEMILACEENGIEFVSADAPDPLSDAGVPGAQKFMVEDIPRKVAQYGADTAFFSTNCSMQEPLIATVLSEKAIFPQQCCPSPYHGYPNALNIDVKGHEGDVAYMIEQIDTKVAEAGNNGRMSTWKFPANMLCVEAGVEYAIDYANGKTGGKKLDAALAKQKMQEVAATYNAECKIKNFTYINSEDEEETFENYFVFLGEYRTF